MIKVQVQLPDHLYESAKKIADQREWSFAEVVRRGLEQMVLLYPAGAGALPAELPILDAVLFSPEFDDLDLRALVESDERRDFGA